MKKTVLFLCLLLSIGAFAQSEVVHATKINSLAISADQIIGQDQFGFIYYVTNNVFYKRKGNQALEYKNIAMGKITVIDIKNPLGVVRYYENFNTMILLDNQLNEVQKINFAENNTSLFVNAIGMSTQNRLWIFNLLDQQIGLLDYLKNEYRAVSTPLSRKIKAYQANYNSFEWIDENLDWYSCDIFGKITTKGSIPAFDKIAIGENDQIIFTREGLVYHFDQIKNKATAINISEKSFSNFDYKDQILSIFTSEGIINYKITIP